MTLRIVLSQLWRDMRSQRLRTTLTLFGLGWGTFCVIVMLSFGEGVSRKQYESASNLGERILILWGSRTSLLVALCAALTSLSLGVAWGALAGLSGGRVDNLMMRALDVLQSIPTIFVVIFLLSFLNAPSAALGGARLLSREQVFFLVIGAVSWLSMARVVRGQVLALRSAPYVEAARAQGASLVWIVRKHVWPNVLPVVVVYVTLTLPAVILYEAFLSFLGLGVEAPNVSWGVLAADGAEALSPLVSSWWLVAAPSTALAATLLALGLVGDGLRDALDLRRGER